MQPIFPYRYKNVHTLLKGLFFVCVTIAFYPTGCTPEAEAPVQSPQEKTIATQETLHQLSNALSLFTKILDGWEDRFILEQQFKAFHLTAKEQQLLELALERRAGQDISHPEAEKLVSLMLNISTRRAPHKVEAPELQRIFYSLRKKALLDFIQQQAPETILRKFVAFHKRTFLADVQRYTHMATYKTHLEEESARAMTTYTITLRGPDYSSTEIDCPGDVYILDAAEEYGIYLPYSCRAGACSTDTAKVISGVVDQSEQIFLDDEQMACGYVLLSVAYPMSNCIIETHKEDELSLSMCSGIDLDEVEVCGNCGDEDTDEAWEDWEDTVPDDPGYDLGGSSEEGSPDHIVIDPVFLVDFPCQAQIVQDVYNNCAPLSQLFQDIFESNDHVHVTFTAEELQGGILQGGDTDGEHPHNYLITLNTSRLNQSTELDLINTTTHEYVHAIMFHYFYSGHFQLTDAGNPPTYAELAEGFAKHRAGFGGDHHPYMASLVNDIAEVTYTWAIANDYAPNDFTDYDTNQEDDIDGLKEFLRKLAWSGLKNTPTFEALYPEGSLEERTIQKIIQDEIFPNDLDANAQGNAPLPCN